MISKKIVKEYLNLLGNKNYEELKKIMNCSEEDLDEAITLIKQLNPKPGQIFKKILPNEYIKNDVNIDLQNNNWEVYLNEDEFNIYCDQKILHELNQKIIEKFGQTNFTGLIWKSDNNITVSKDKADTLFKLLNILEENEDVQVVSSNFDVSDDVLASLTA